MDMSESRRQVISSSKSLRGRGRTAAEEVPVAMQGEMVVRSGGGRGPKAAVTVIMAVCLAWIGAGHAQAATCAAAWSCGTSYGSGAQASFGGHNYTMAYSRAATCPGYDPSADNWWTDNGACTSGG